MQIGKALGDEDGPPQVGCTDAWAEMPMAIRFLWGEDEAAAACLWKHVLAK